jgi:molybdate transport system ATP-binding protein
MGAVSSNPAMIEARIVREFPAKRDSPAFQLEIEFEAGPGITVLFGPSGSGKTLTLDCIAGFSTPNVGRILIDDAIVFDSGARVNLRPQERRCGYVFQNYALFPHMSLRDNLQFAAVRSKRLERNGKIGAMLERFRLSDVAGRKPHEVSGGQKQRCSIARALVSDPKILLLDEPARGLDAPLRADLYALLHQVRADFEMPILLVTHDLDECFELGDRMLVINKGELVQTGSPAEVCARPASVDLARLLGAFNLFSVEILTLDPSRNSSTLRWGEFELRGEYYPAHFRGDRVQLLATPRQLRAMPRLERPGPNQVPVELVRIVEMPDTVRLEFDGGIRVEMPRGQIDRNNRDWLVEFPERGLRIL